MSLVYNSNCRYGLITVKTVVFLLQLSSSVVSLQRIMHIAISVVMCSIGLQWLGRLFITDLLMGIGDDSVVE